MKIVVTGPKSAGKSTVADRMGEMLDVEAIDVDQVIELLYEERGGEQKSFREIYRERGKEYFRDLEKKAVDRMAGMDWCILSTGGSSLKNPESRRLLRPDSIWVYLDAPVEVLWERISTGGLPAFLDDADDPRAAFERRTEQLRDILLPRCDAVVEAGDYTPDEVAEAALHRCSAEIASRSQSANTFGDALRLTTFGESHGPMVGAVLDGLPPDVEIDEEYIQKELDRRKPGQSKVSTKRKESDRIRIVSGVFEGRTTGTPIGMLIKNKDSHSKDYEAFRELFRPGHADYTFWRKYGIRDHRGGGRSSGRETASRVAGGAIAAQILERRGVEIRACTTRVGDVTAEEIRWDCVEDNSVRCGDPEAAEHMREVIVEAQSRGDSVGGMVRAEVHGLPAGLGDPVFAKLDARLARAVFSIGAVKGCEIGAGFEVAGMYGSENNDQMSDMEFESNNAGGVLGGISSGQPLTMRLAIKPTPSVSVPQHTCDVDGQDQDLTIEGRHDPCIAPRVVPVVESMIALVLLDAWQIQERLNPGWWKEQ